MAAFQLEECCRIPPDRSIGVLYPLLVGAIFHNVVVDAMLMNCREKVQFSSGKYENGDIVSASLLRDIRRIDRMDRLVALEGRRYGGINTSEHDCGGIAILLLLE